MTAQKIITKAVLGEAVEGNHIEHFNQARDKLHQKRMDFETTLNHTYQFKNELASVPMLIPPNANDILARARIEIGNANKKIDDAIRVLKGFRLTHGRLTLPRSPSVIKSTLVCGVATLIESGINSLFFMNAHLTASPISAMLTSTLISGTNVFVSVTAGFYIGRWLDWGSNANQPNNSEFRTPRVRAKVLLILYIALMTYMHFTIAGIRATENLHQVIHSFETYYQIATTPESLFIIMVGACLSLFAFREGKHGFSDPYPEYGALADRVEEEEDSLHGLHEDFADDIHELFDKAIETAKEDIADYQQQFKDYNSQVDVCHRNHRAFQDAIQDAEGYLQSEISKVEEIYASVLGTAVSQNTDVSSAYSNLSESVDYELPEYLSVPDTQNFDAECIQARDEALATLASFLQTRTGE